MEIRWLGTASAEVVCGGRHLLIDPYFQKTWRTRKWQNPVLRDAVTRADAILITHPHLDHFADIGRIVRLTDAPVYVAAQGKRSAEKRGVKTGTLRELYGGMTFSIGDAAEVRVWRSRHVQFDETLKKAVKKRAFRPDHFPRGLQIWRLSQAFPITDDDVFAFEIRGEGKMLFALGSVNLREDEVYPTGADALLFPYQGRSDLDRWSVPILERLNPRKIVLTHFDDAFPPISERIDTGRIRERFPDAMEPAFNEAILL